MIIGVDFDNTIVSYDEVIHQIACEKGLIPGSHLKSKRHIRDAIRKLENGEMEWQKVQAIVYGPRMKDAKVIEGALVFLKLCKRLGIKLYIISHKTEYSNLGGSMVNLRDAALNWMRKNDLFDSEELGISPDNVYFESTREEKIERIKKLGCTHFIDDLEETFLEPSFPKDTFKILYAPKMKKISMNGLELANSWDEINYLMQREIISKYKFNDVLSALIDVRIESIDNIGNGKNGRVYRLNCEKNRKYAVKFYYRHVLDDRDRLNIEYSCLEFLWKNGIRNIPKPIACDRSLGCGIYEYVEGKKISKNGISNDEVDQAVEFIGKLKELKDAKGSDDIPSASEAFFSIRDIIMNIKGRAGKLTALRDDSAQYEALQTYLNKDLLPSLDEIIEWGAAAAGKEGISFSSELKREERTLSPSDYGFHNSLKKDDGKIVFLDYEYFGWDDPAKLISDFLLHPAMGLSEGLKRRFVNGAIKKFAKDPKLGKRMEIVYPLFGIKWCLILLNEFLPEHMGRRRFAKKGEIDNKKILIEQLAKSEEMLRKVSGKYKRFPYFG